MAWETEGASERRRRLPPDWPWRTGRVMHRDRAICHWCGEPGADAIDHVEAGDDHRLENLAPIHQDVPPYCHREKTALEAQAARQRIRDARTRPLEPHPLDGKESP